MVSQNYFPVNAARFLDENKLYGRIFNPTNWGGYLVWKFSPRSKFYTDSRYLDYGLVEEIKLVYALKKTESGEPVWKEVMNRDRVDVVLLPRYEARGRPLPLSQSFELDREWKVVFRDSRAVVFERERYL